MNLNYARRVVVLVPGEENMIIYDLFGVEYRNLPYWSRT